MKDNYDDIINLPHHVSNRHPHMSIAERGALFSPFAALTGYNETLDENARMVIDEMMLRGEQRIDDPEIMSSFQKSEEDS